MSLDVYLTSKEARMASGTGVYVRENGATRELTLAEVAERWPNADVVESEHMDDEVYSRNITHNLNTMAGEAGIYEHLWRPDEIDVTTAAQLIEPLRNGLALLKSDPERFKAFNPANGWGDYDGLVDFVTEYLAACEAHPNAEVRASR